MTLIKMLCVVYWMMICYAMLLTMFLTLYQNPALRQKTRVNDGEVSCLSLSRR